MSSPRVLDEHLSPAAVAKRLGVSLRTVQRWIYRGEIAPVYRPGGRILLIPARAVSVFLERWRL